MRIFKEFRQYYESRDDQSINRIIEAASQNIAVQGVLFEMNSAWLNLWRLNTEYGHRWLTDRLRFWWEFQKYYPFPFPSPVYWESYVLDLSRLYLESESWYTNENLGWDQFNSFRKELLSLSDGPRNYPTFPPPFTLLICLRPSSEPFNLNVDYRQDDNFNVASEVRPISYLWNAAQKLHRPIVGGTSIGTGDTDFGTLGGILTNPETGKNYGITCSHVVKDKSEVFHPAKCDDKKAIHLGTVIHRSSLKALPMQYYQTKNLSSANEVDVAVIELAEPADGTILEIGSVYDIFPDDRMVPNIGVVFRGRSSVHKMGLYLDAEVLFYDLEESSIKYRFKNLVQVRLDGKMTNFFGTPTKDGDSGAWVFTAGTAGPSWCGMVIGGFGDRGFVISAEKVVNWIKNEAKLDLELMP
jgi:hypothetical protein